MNNKYLYTINENKSIIRLTKTDGSERDVVRFIKNGEIYDNGNGRYWNHIESKDVKVNAFTNGANPWYTVITEYGVTRRQIADRTTFISVVVNECERRGATSAIAFIDGCGKPIDVKFDASCYYCGKYTAVDQYISQSIWGHYRSQNWWKIFNLSFIVNDKIEEELWCSIFLKKTEGIFWLQSFFISMNSLWHLFKLKII